MNDELEPLDPDEDWVPDASQAPEGERGEARPTRTARRVRSRRRIAVLLVVAAGLITWAAVGHHRRPKPRATGPVTLTPSLVGQRALRLVSDVARNHDDVVAAQFAPALAQQLDALGLKASWQRVIAAYGPMRRSEAPSVTGDGDYAYGVHVLVDLARGAISLQLVYLVPGRIASLYFLPAQAPHPPTLSPSYVESRATSIVHDLAVGNDGAVVGELNPLSRAAVNADHVRLGWDNFEAAYGTFVSAAPAAVSPVRDDVVDVPIHWAHFDSVFVVAFDWNGQVAGLVLLPPDAPSEASYLSPLPVNAAASEGATEVCRDVVARDYVDVVARFDPLATAANTPSQMQGTWLHVVAKLGRLRSIGSPAVLGDGPDAIWYEFDLAFQHGHAHVQVEMDNNVRVAALLILAGPPTRTFAR